MRLHDECDTRRNKNGASKGTAIVYLPRRCLFKEVDFFITWDNIYLGQLTLGW